ncbi:MAG: glutamine--tRNA ligase [Tenericutes bacterium GWC2_34_14]|nr:MAG: glutamine--tRNA ligase [Tenericutes bacterium GWA2_35_7]OHE28146.1 MAG: glutamine--tRNA ligase [Tenericutes bacterium GWC2_34_14]OHE32914.1 MAG: glutamine--tRNA ligase [Tenericutes bacterium GWE2_34_108]OHE36121.1 MAG: glutamine--tRNA ligase [Tenericutes bacterium GWF1_35_14]OHE39344.1 MAG: glutamine--tRNA ligase [Tenericutes bacterium GWF2_35_184]OHE43826.1 MAG: glutamine--tRNA ligase [Tenericutes bacterium RIFOXYA12_FULL_35_10]OHE44617.1 MAG: glutamine--tRNA ligase [Tenericutes bact
MEKISNFITTIIESDLESGKHDEIVTRFPPEPNGFLHIGHARAIITDFESARQYNGYTNLRYDDTNPSKEDDVYVRSILEDIRWLGYEPKNILFASDYFEEMYERAVLLIKKGLAYVDHSTPEQMAKDRGNLQTPGVPSAYRNRSVEENLKLFNDMREGKFKEGECVLRAKIDMTSPNMNMRDPALYRISYAEHHNTGKKWCIYPMYDYAHPLEDAIEGITHSLCSLEFEDHRPLYDWVVRETEMPKVPRQIEFGRLSIENTVMSKRFLRQLVEENKVIGWDDPRMPTLSGLRRRGYTPEAIRKFVISTGLSKVNSTVGTDMLEAALRDDLAEKALRVMAVINPLKVTLTNYEENKVEYFEVPYHSEKPELGSRRIPFSKHLFIEKDDFIVTKPNNKYKRLSLGDEVRLFHSYFIKANDVIYDTEGNVIEVLATYDPATRSGSGFNERKPNGTIHFVEQTHANKATLNFFGPMILGDDDMDLMDRFNKDSWTVKEGFVEEALKDAKPQDKFQFMRNGYFNTDLDSKEGKLIFNEIVPLKSSYK